MADTDPFQRGDRSGPHPVTAARRACRLGAVAVWLAAAAAGASAQAPGPAAPRLQAQVGHTDQTTFMFPTCAAYSPDGRFLVTGGSDKTARLWESASGVELRTFRDGVDAVSFVAISPGARHLLTANGAGTMRLWDARTGAELRRFPSTWEGAFSADGARLFVPGAGGVRVYAAETGALVRTIRGAASNVAVTADGSRLLAADAGGRIRAWDARTYAPLRVSGVRVPDEGGGARFSADGRFAAIGESESTIRLVELSTGRELARFDDHPAAVTAFAISPDGRRVLTATDRPDAAVRLFDVGAGAGPGRRFEFGYEIFGLLFAPGGEDFLSLHRTGEVALRRASDGEAIREFGGLVELAWPAAFSASGRYVVCQGTRAISIWDLATGAVVRRISAAGEELLPDVARTSDGRALLAESPDRPPELYGPPAALLAAGAAVFSADLRLAITGSDDGGGSPVTEVWDARTGAPLGRVPGGGALLSADGRRLVVRGTGGVEVWDPAAPKRLAAFGTVGEAAAVSADGGLVAVETASSIRLLETASGREVRRFAHRRGDLSTIRFSPAADRLAAGGTDGLTVWEVATGRAIARPRRDAFYATVDVSFSPDGARLLTGGAGPARLLDAATGSELCTLVSFRDGTWAVTDPAGRFDTDALDGTKGLYWLVPDDPHTPLPIEVFLRDLYEPRLLPRLLAGAELPPARDLSSLNRVQPEVRLLDAAPSAGRPDLLTVRVRVAGASRAYEGSSGPATRSTGVRDVRLFRDGQLVAYAPAAGGAVELDPETDSAVLVFEGIRVPRLAGRRRIELSAYAFNDDRVKSRTDRLSYEVPRELAPVRGRAFVVGIGVNEYGDPQVDLRFAANDARELARVAGDRLAATTAFEEVVPVLLSAERGAPSRATKASIRALFDALSGRPFDPAALEGAPGAGRLRPAGPEDVVIVSFSGHGYAGARGDFYLVPSDGLAGRGAAAPAGGADGSRRIELSGAMAPGRAPSGWISSDELALWLRDLDAGELVLIVDACQSAASVEGEGFKPGPMGSRGLGQLAYDKGMLVLAATQADNVAIERRGLEHGLLSYALLLEGLEAGLADFRPKDGTVWMREWLDYGVARVPVLAAAGRAPLGGAGGAARLLVHPTGGAVPGDSAGARRVLGKIQTPILFDFSRARREVAVFVTAERP